MKIIRFLFILLGVGLMFVFGFGYGRWYSTKPAPGRNERIVLYYVDAMHPWYKSDKPGLAPDCGMKLEPVYSSGEGPKNAPPTPDSVEVTADQRRLSGVRYGQAEWGEASETIHAAGRVVPDETLLTRVQARADGWILKVSADFTGKSVTEGQPLLTLYSPDLIAAQQEYLLALKARSLMRHSSMLESMANNDALADAARRRLMLLNLTDAQIAQVEETQKPLPSVTLYAPSSGFVMTRNAFPGQRVTPETELYTLLDLSDVWVMADVFELDAQRVRIGQAAHITVPGAPPVFARVTYIQPQVDPATRTTKVRLGLANKNLQLRPDMWVTVDIDFGGTRRLSVPAEAVLDSGTIKTVFVDRDKDYFEPRPVETGARFTDRTGNRVEIVKGLNAGDRIVTSGTFLLNSESQMKSGGGMADMPGMPAKPTVKVPGATPVTPETPDMPGMPAKKAGEK